MQARTALHSIGIALVLVVSVQAQITSYPELFAGEWETTTPSGAIHGVWLTIRTQHLSKTGPNYQATEFSFYRRQNGVETKPSFSGSLSFNSGHLRVGGPDGLDLTFDMNSHRWTGVWFLEGEHRRVVLERPSCPTLNLCGRWEGRDPSGPIRIYIAQSSDDVVTAWLDRTSDLKNQQHGQRIEVVSSVPANFVLETPSTGCCVNRFFGAALL